MNDKMVQSVKVFLLQVFHLLGAGILIYGHDCDDEPAGWRPATRQIGNLRYENVTLDGRARLPALRAVSPYRQSDSIRLSPAQSDSNQAIRPIKKKFYFA